LKREEYATAINCHGLQETFKRVEEITTIIFHGLQSIIRKKGPK
jgi:hypothetical protein